MMQAEAVSRNLWESVRRCTDAVNREKGIYGTPRHSLMVTLHETCAKAFTAWESEADTIEQSVKAMRILAEDMRG